MLDRGKLPDTDRVAIRDWLGKASRAGAGLRSRGLLFGLAQVLDAQGEYAEAAACLARANAMTLEYRRHQGHTYDASAHSAFVDRLIASFTPALFARLAAAGDDSRTQVAGSKVGSAR